MKLSVKACLVLLRLRRFFPKGVDRMIYDTIRLSFESSPDWTAAQLIGALGWSTNSRFSAALLDLIWCMPTYLSEASVQLRKHFAIIPGESLHDKIYTCRCSLTVAFPADDMLFADFGVYLADAVVEKASKSLRK